MAVYYAPHVQEIPSGFENRFKVFGMGPESARMLARNLSLTKPLGPIIILGSAGSLKPNLKPGQCFLIKELYAKGERKKLEIPKVLDFFPQASLISVEKPITRSETKLKVGLETGCDLVDCEMEFLWDEISEDLHDRLIFIRGVLDSAEENLDFLEDFQIRWHSLIQPKQMFQFARFVRNFFRYQRGMREFFGRLSNSLMLRDETEVSQIF